MKLKNDFASGFDHEEPMGISLSTHLDDMVTNHPTANIIAFA